MILSAARKLVVLMSLATLPVPGTAQEPGTDELRNTFVRAYRDAVIGLEPGVADSTLEDYVLYPYIQAARIGRKLATTDNDDNSGDDAAEAFLAMHATEPVTRPVASAWLESLERRGRQTEFIERFSSALASTALECRYLAARIETAVLEGLDDLIIARWLTGSQLPLECEPVFEWGRSSGVIDEAAIAARVRLLLENGSPRFARIIARRLPDATAAPLNRWADLIETPAPSFAALIAAPDTYPGDDALLDAWSRYARNSPGDARALADRLIDALDPDAALTSKLRRALALGLAWDRDSDALTFFSGVGRRDMDDYTREWQIRAALWAGEWPTAADAIDALSETMRNESAWRYWTARAQAELANADNAAAAFEAVVGDDNFYAALASARLGRRHRPAHQPLDVPASDVAAVAVLPGFVRARELHAVGMEPEARREWNAGYADMPADFRRASIRLAASWGWYEIAVLTATRNDVFFDYELLYPLRFTEHVPAAADLTAFDRGLLYGLIRQESLFTPDAVSSAGAIGLTQLRLETARRAATRWEIERPSRSALFDPATNITLGAAQLRSLIDEFGGQVLPGLAGYNAGYNAAARWLPDTEIAADIWVENIPFNETRAYVRRVLWHSLVYDWLETRQPQDASDWLTPVRRP